jgi:hypothetical protein
MSKIKIDLVKAKSLKRDAIEQCFGEVNLLANRVMDEESRNQTEILKNDLIVLRGLVEKASTVEALHLLSLEPIRQTLRERKA